MVHLLIIIFGGVGLLLTKRWWSYAAEETREKVPA
jgi:hypothetical protein